MWPLGDVHTVEPHLPQAPPPHHPHRHSLAHENDVASGHVHQAGHTVTEARGDDAARPADVHGLDLRKVSELPTRHAVRSHMEDSVQRSLYGTCEGRVDGFRVCNTSRDELQPRRQRLRRRTDVEENNLHALLRELGCEAESKITTASRHEGALGAGVAAANSRCWKSACSHWCVLI